MSFRFSERHIDEYRNDGYTVFRKILPPSLVTDLRRVTDVAREMARAQGGAQTQRTPVIAKLDIDKKPFEDYRDLPPLRDAIARVLSPQHAIGNFEWMSVLLEPADQPYCMRWHRDARQFFTDDEWHRLLDNTKMGSQINCPLYEDTCTWFVPGSHRRENTPEEDAILPPREGRQLMPNAPNPCKQMEGWSNEERERACLEYCESMPGAVRLVLDAGDLALYRPLGWHLGNYVPYRKRATVHDGAFTPQTTEWLKVLPRLQERHEGSVTPLPELEALIAP